MLGRRHRWWWSYLLEAIEYDVRVKGVDTCDFKGSEYQRFGKGVDPGRPEEAYKVCLTRGEPSLGVVVMIYELI